MSDDGVRLEGDAVTAFFDARLRAVYGVTWEAFAARWKEALAQHLREPASPVPPGAEAAVRALFRERDEAMRTGEAARLRATMESFRCGADDWTEQARQDLARRLTTPAREVSTQVLEVLSGGVANYELVYARVEQRAGQTVERFVAQVEHYPEGWRVLSMDPR